MQVRIVAEFLEAIGEKPVLRKNWFLVGALVLDVIQKLYIN